MPQNGVNIKTVGRKPGHHVACFTLRTNAYNTNCQPGRSSWPHDRKHGSAKPVTVLTKKTMAGVLKKTSAPAVFATDDGYEETCEKNRTVWYLPGICRGWFWPTKTLVVIWRGQMFFCPRQRALINAQRRLISDDIVYSNNSLRLWRIRSCLILPFNSAFLQGVRYTSGRANSWLRLPWATDSICAVFLLLPRICRSIWHSECTYMIKAVMMLESGGQGDNSIRAKDYYVLDVAKITHSNKPIS